MPVKKTINVRGRPHWKSAKQLSAEEARASKPDPLKPSMQLLMKLGSIVVHADEGTSPTGGHVFDVSAARVLLDDPEVAAWIAAMGPLLPRKRSAR